MTGIKYADRLIEDINRSADTRRRVSDSQTQIEVLAQTGQANPSNFWSALNVSATDEHLGIISSFINTKACLVDHNQGQQVNIEVWQRDLTANRESVGEVFQQILDGNQIIDIMSGRSIKELLLEQLDYIHQAASY